MDMFNGLATEIWLQLLEVLSYPIDPHQRLYIPYLLATLAIVGILYFLSLVKAEGFRPGQGIFRGFFSFLFPRSVWSNPSAWVDVRYFIPHQFVRLLIYVDLSVFVISLTSNWSLAGLQALSGEQSLSIASPDSIPVGVCYAVVAILVVDFTAFFLHYLQHKIPLLWEFHKVHHSVSVLHPISNYREHPVDNLLYGVALGIVLGALAGIVQFLFAVDPADLAIGIIGFAVSKFAFNMLGYNLRHSHIWLRWPGVLGYVFGCPAHHQIHHSCKPEHIDRNLAFMFPVWDLIFGTFCLPDKEVELVFGIGDGTEAEYKSFASIYYLPFRNLLWPRESQTDGERER